MIPCKWGKLNCLIDSRIMDNRHKGLYFECLETNSNFDKNHHHLDVYNKVDRHGG